jgi:Carboxypeptidase regulatory-like domain/TonB dependent receptor-like, beta-barrel
MRRYVSTAVVLLSLFVSFNAFSQSTNATVGGTVQDATGAFIPGVTVTATNVGTGIVTMVVSNEAGVYQFASLQPGTYEIKSELPGFQTAIVKDFPLGGAQQARLNFTLQVAAAAGTTIDVAVAADALLATSSNSVGTILPEYKVRDLPLAVRDVMGLVAQTAGVQSSGGLISNFAGGRISQLNTTRDGMNVSAGRFEDGAWSLTYTSPDLVEEVKVVVAPVDAQTSRGSGQVSMVTRSGTNQLHGTVFWANHNSALDASTWFNNLNNVPKNYDNRNQYGARIGGPIVKNKTFFFLLFEGQRDLKRENVVGTTLTDMARQGIFRYFPGVDNGNVNSANPTVNRDGTPLKPATATGDLAAIDLFGNCTFNGAPVANCRTYRDPLYPRLAISTSAYMQETLRRMPHPNEFTAQATGEPATDGLNTANIRFVRRVEGLDFTLGNGPDVDRDQYNARIDHVFNSKHKLSFIGTKEKTWGNASQAVQRSWPDGTDGLAVKRPDVYIMTFTSTLSSTLLNELRLGRRRSIDLQYSPANRPDAIGEDVLQFVPVANGVRFDTEPQLWRPFERYGRFGRWRGHVSPMYSIGDDLSWTHGKHAFKGGFEFRNTLSSGFGDPGFTPYATFGAGNQTITGLDGTAFPGLTANAATTARNLLTDLTASIGTINQSFGIKSATDTTLKGSPEIPAKYFRQVQREISVYFKDEWKFRPDLTLNLGVHWEYYGQPFEKTGLDARVIGDNESAFTKLSCPSSLGTGGFDTTCSNLTQVQFVGKNSTHPDILPNLKGNDLNNWAPAVGLSWNLPWFGKNKTVLRSGYGINYIGALRNFITVDNTLGTVPGINIVGSGGTGLTYNPTTYTDISTVTLPVPFPTGTPTASPFVVPTTDRAQTISTYNRVSAYAQNWNLEIQRQLAENTTIEVRYIGTKGSKLWGTINLNQIDALHHNKELFDAFNTVRAGGDSPLLTQMLMGINLGGTGAQAVNGASWTGAMAVRTNTTTRTQLATGNVGGFLDFLNTNTTGTGSANRGAILRRNGFPENYIVVNPQYANVSMLNNLGNSTYHSLQMQFTRRLTRGFTNTTTWTWSRSLGDSDTDGGANYRDPTRRSLEKTLLGFDRQHQITSNGTFELPFGTGHFLLGNAPGWVQQIVNKWQLGGIMNFNTGTPLNLTTCTLVAGNCTAGTGVYTISFSGQSAAGTPNVVGALPKDMGKVTKVSNGVVYFDGFRQVTDPGFSTVSPNCGATTACNGLVSGYSNRAIQGPDGQVILVNPQPGELGTLGYSTVRGPKLLNFDMNLIKRFQIHEAKNFEFRLDVINILNHPNFGTPNTNINAANNAFGSITSATGSRSFIVNTRINF